MALIFYSPSLRLPVGGSGTKDGLANCEAKSAHAREVLIANLAHFASFLTLLQLDIFH